MGRRWRTPVGFLVLASVAMPFGFAAWQALLNNFAIERAAFTGREIGILQSLREVPGFLAFTAVFVILVLREQSFACVTVALFGIGVALTGFLPTEYGLYFTTVLMSVGFHYFETVRQSLSLQWLAKDEAPRIPQRKRLVLRKRYWLYYALTFLSGARRQIFVVFAGFLLLAQNVPWRPRAGNETVASPGWLRATTG